MTLLKISKGNICQPSFNVRHRHLQSSGGWRERVCKTQAQLSLNYPVRVRTCPYPSVLLPHICSTILSLTISSSGTYVRKNILSEYFQLTKIVKYVVQQSLQWKQQSFRCPSPVPRELGHLRETMWNTGFPPPHQTKTRDMKIFITQDSSLGIKWFLPFSSVFFKIQITFWGNHLRSLVLFVTKNALCVFLEEGGQREGDTIFLIKRWEMS